MLIYFTTILITSESLAFVRPFLIHFYKIILYAISWCNYLSFENQSLPLTRLRAWFTFYGKCIFIVSAPQESWSDKQTNSYSFLCPGQTGLMALLYGLWYRLPNTFYQIYQISIMLCTHLIHTAGKNINDQCVVSFPMIYCMPLFGSIAWQCVWYGEELLTEYWTTHEPLCQSGQ